PARLRVLRSARLPRSVPGDLAVLQAALRVTRHRRSHVDAGPNREALPPRRQPPDRARSAGRHAGRPVRLRPGAVAERADRPRRAARAGLHADPVAASAFLPKTVKSSTRRRRPGVKVAAW